MTKQYVSNEYSSDKDREASKTWVKNSKRQADKIVFGEDNVMKIEKIPLEPLPIN